MHVQRSMQFFKLIPLILWYFWSQTSQKFYFDLFELYDLFDTKLHHAASKLNFEKRKKNKMVHYLRYSLAFKLKMVEYAKANSIRQAKINYSVSRKQIRIWVKN